MFLGRGEANLSAKHVEDRKHGLKKKSLSFKRSLT